MGWEKRGSRERARKERRARQRNPLLRVAKIRSAVKKGANKAATIVGGREEDPRDR